MRSKRSDRDEIGPTEEGLYFIQRSVRSIRPGGYRLDLFGSFCVKTKRMYLPYANNLHPQNRISNVRQPSWLKDWTETVRDEAKGGIDLSH